MFVCMECLLVLSKTHRAPCVQKKLWPDRMPGVMSEHEHTYSWPDCDGILYSSLGEYNIIQSEGAFGHNYACSPSGAGAESLNACMVAVTDDRPGFVVPASRRCFVRDTPALAVDRCPSKSLRVRDQ
jgi:hypothetical protein